MSTANKKPTESVSLNAFKQPKAFYLIFSIELWERFGYYGLQGIMAVYLVKQLGMSEADSITLFSSFSALVYGLVAIGMVLCSGAFLILPLGAKFANDAGIVSVNWLIASYGLQSIGELMISGLGLAMVAQLVPQRLMGFIMGSWFLTTAGANIIGGYVANLMAVPSDVTDPLMSLEVYGRVFMQIGIATAVIAVLMLLTAPKLNRMTQDDDTAEKGSKAATV